MNIAYCEDEKIQLEYMEQLIKKWADEGNDTVTYFGYGSAKELLFEHPDSFPFDLLLLDIDMDGMDGMALAKEIRKKDQKLPIVFLTNRSEYVFEGYEVGALRYLLKPVEETKLFSLLDEISYALGKERRIGADFQFNGVTFEIYLRRHFLNVDLQFNRRKSRNGFKKQPLDFFGGSISHTTADPSTLRTRNQSRRPPAADRLCPLYPDRSCFHEP